MMRLSPCAASAFVTTRPFSASRTEAWTTISCSGIPMPRNWTFRRRSARGSPPAASVCALATWAIEYRPCRMFCGRPTALANSGSMWIGLKSPDAPAYRCGRYLSGVTRRSGRDSPGSMAAKLPLEPGLSAVDGRQVPAMRFSLTLLGTILATALTALAFSASQAGANPLDKKGMWVWYVSASGGSPQAVAAKAKRHNIGTVFVKSGDAGNYWSQFSSDLVHTLHSRGIRVCAWQFVYGSDPLDEARVGARAARTGADCLIIDAESNYEGRYGPADRYVRKLRSKVGGKYPLGLAGFPYVDYHPSFPYSVFLGRRGAKWNVPQMYWKTIGPSVRPVYEHPSLYTPPYDRRIYPLGQTWQDPGRTGITDFRKYAR